MLKKLALPAALLIAAAAVHAQQQPAPQAGQPPLSPQQQAQLNQLAKPIAQAALQTAQQIDQGKFGEVWDGASSSIKPLVSRDAFVKGIAADRKTVGALKSRNFAGESASVNPAGAPPGTYMNVQFATQFANTKQPVRELISYHLDADNKWRVSGYTLR